MTLVSVKQDVLVSAEVDYDDVWEAGWCLYLCSHIIPGDDIMIFIKQSSSYEYVCYSFPVGGFVIPAAEKIYNPASDHPLYDAIRHTKDIFE